MGYIEYRAQLVALLGMAADDPNLGIAELEYRVAHKRDVDWDRANLSSAGTPVRVQLASDKTVPNNSTDNEIDTNWVVHFTTGANGRALIKGNMVATPPATGSAQHDFAVKVDIVKDSDSSVAVSKAGIGGYAFDNGQSVGARINIPLHNLFTGLNPGTAYTAHIFWNTTTALAASWSCAAGSRGIVSTNTYVSVEPS